MERVRVEMMQERAVALREQEDRLGSMVAQLQVNKAKEVCIGNSLSASHPFSFSLIIDYF